MKALQKLAADRFETAAKFAEALANPEFSLPATLTRAPGIPGREARTWNRTAVGFAALSVLLAVTSAWFMMRPPPTAPMIRFALQRPPTMGQGNIVDILPDGSGAVMTYPAESGEMGLWLHRWTDGSVLSL